MNNNNNITHTQTSKQTTHTQRTSTKENGPMENPQQWATTAPNWRTSASTHSSRGGASATGRVPIVFGSTAATAWGNLSAATSSVQAVAICSAPKSELTARDKPTSNCNTAAEQRKKHIRPSKKAYYDRRLAVNIINRLIRFEPSQLTEEQATSLQWAKEILLAKKASNEAGAPLVKGQSSDKETLAAKRLRVDGNEGDVSCSEVNKCGGVVLAIIDNQEEGGSIPHEKWEWVEAELAAVYHEVLEEYPGSPPTCENAGWHEDRIKLIACGDARSALLYKAAISKVGEVWPGASLVAVDRDQIPAMPKAWAWLPVKPSEPEAILKLMRDCNPDVPVYNWTVEKLVEPVGAKRQVLFRINTESLAPLEKKDWNVRYGFATIHLQNNQRDGELSETSEKGGITETSPPNGVEVSPMGNASSDIEERGNADSNDFLSQTASPGTKGLQLVEEQYDEAYLVDEDVDATAVEEEEPAHAQGFSN